MKQKTAQKALSLLLTVVLLFSLAPAVFAESGGHIAVVGQKNADVAQGEQYRLDLKNVFTDNEGHKLTFTVANDGANKSTTAISNGVYYFTSPETGTYHPTITANCDSGSASLTLDITVTAGKITDVKQYDYNETDADQVTVYVTISSDGIPVVGKDMDETILSHVKVTVPYFDLAYYDHPDYYRYATENGQGGYTGDEVIKRPTAMHLFIYMLERFYLGYPESECGTGEHNDELFGGSRNDDIRNMYGDTAYKGTLSPLYYTGGATSTYMQNFWGHDENLMYYRNHRYPLMSPGWGATSDYMLLSDGDTIDLAMFSNWEFYHQGAFCCIGAADSNEPVETLQVTQGDMLRFTGLKYGTQSVADGGVDGFARVSGDDGITYVLFDQNWEDTGFCPETISDNGVFELDTTNLVPGTYHLIGLDPNAGTEDACDAPATCDLTVTKFCKHVPGEYSFTDKQDGSFAYVRTCMACNAELTAGSRLFGDVTGDGVIDSQDATLAYAFANGKQIADELQIAAADVNKDDSVDLQDADLTYDFANGKVTSFR